MIYFFRDLYGMRRDMSFNNEESVMLSVCL